MSRRMDWDAAAKRDQVRERVAVAHNTFAWWWTPLKWPTRCTDCGNTMVGLMAYNHDAGEKLCELCAQSRKVDIGMSRRGKEWMAQQSGASS